MMAVRITNRARILVDRTVAPIYRKMLRTHCGQTPLVVEEIASKNGFSNEAAFRERLDSSVAAAVVQYPNYFGIIQDFGGLAQAAHAAGALLIISAYPLALGLLKPPGAMGADIVTAEGQSLGLPLSFGGPYLGIMATRKAFVRQMPGRLAGATRDANGRRGFVLTLQAREQHIRREKAVSNICTNQAWCALRALIYLSLVGPEGLREVATLCAARAAYAKQRLVSLPGVSLTFDAPFFNEFAVTLPVPAEEIVRRLLHKGIAAGIPLGRDYEGMECVLLVSCTERRTIAEIDAYAAALEAELRGTS